jgi:hypothetical protein
MNNLFSSSLLKNFFSNVEPKYPAKKAGRICPVAFILRGK